MAQLVPRLLKKCYLDQMSLPFTFLQVSLILPTLVLAPDFVHAAPAFTDVFDPLTIDTTVELVAILRVDRARV